VIVRCSSFAIGLRSHENTLDYVSVLDRLSGHSADLHARSCISIDDAMSFAICNIQGLGHLAMLNNPGLYPGDAA
jgi:hypothetical protein